MIKVLFVAHSGTRLGGATPALMSLMCMLRERYDVQPSLLIPAGDTSILSECEQLGIPVYVGRYHSCCSVFHREARDVLRLVKLLTAPLLDRLSLSSLDRRLPDDFDLVYTNDRMVIAGGYLARRRGIPHIWHVRAFGREVHNIYPPFWSRLMNTYADRVVGISNAIIDSLRPQVAEDKLRLIHDGLETDRYVELPRKPHEGFHILLTAHIVPLKGQMEALEAMNLLVNEKNIDAHLHFAGVVPAYGSRKYDRALKEYIRTHQLTERVHFLGQVSDMSDLRSRMDTELECCWCEPFGRVTVEAMLSGLPVIGSKAGGTLDILEEGVSGLLYELHNPADLAEKLAWVYSHPAEAREMAVRGKQRALDCFTLERSVSNIHALITDTVVE